MPRGRGAVLGALGVLLVAGTARAEAEDQVGFGVFVGADFPLAATAGVNFSLPGRFHLTGGIGEVPLAFRSLVGNAGASAGLWSAEVADFVGAGEDETSVYSLGFGWRPFRGSGFLVELEAMHLEYQATAPVGQVMGALAPDDPPIRPYEGMTAQTLDLSLAMDLVGGQVGWMWTLGPVFARLSVGGLTAIRAEAEAAVNWSDGSQTDLALFGKKRKARLEGQLVRNVKAPTASLRIGVELL